MRLWRAHVAPQTGAGQAPGPLPEAGGLLDQAAYMLSAFDVMTEAYVRLRDRIEDED